MRLTNTTCKNAKPAADKAYKLADGGGMYLEVTASGGKYWRLKYRFADKEKRLALGVYPQVSLAEARERREAAKKQLSNGIDPSFAKQENKRQSALNAENTFEVVAREWHEHQKARWSPTHATDILHRLEKDVFPILGNRPIADIKAPHILQNLRKIEKRGAHEMARRAIQYCGQIFRYAIVTGRAERDPTGDLRGALQPVQHGHYAAIESDELPEFLRTLENNDARLFIQTRLAVRLLMLTFVRTGEMIGAKWNEIDLEGRQWTIPPERMKMRRPHIVPLSKQAVAVLQEQKKLTGQWEWVFPNQAHPRRHMSNNTVLSALKRLGYKGRMTGHGFRALAMSTIKEKLGYRHEVVDRQLAHAPRNKVDAAYDRAQFLPERRKMMQHWADYLDTVANGGKVLIGKFGKTA
jgi:integrase